MRRLTALVAVPLLAFGLACAGLDPASLQGQPPPDPSWVGVWEGPGRSLVIHPDGMVEVSSSGGTNQHLTAPAQRFTTTEIAVGIGPFVETLRVDQPPAQTEAGWTMTVDGVVLRRTMDVASSPSLILNGAGGDWAPTPPAPPPTP
jgi:hypothetical protein